MKKILFDNLLIKSNQKEDGYFSGYASVYNEIDAYKDIVLPGAFKECLKNPSNIKLLWQHEAKTPIGIFSKIEETQTGLYVEGKILTSTPKGHEVYELIKNGAINGLSIGFEVEQYVTKGEYRIITKGKLWEISIVTFPANDAARIIDVKDSGQAWSKLIKSLDKATNALNALKYNQTDSTKTISLLQ